MSNDFTKDELEHIKVCLEDNYEACSCGQIEGINRHHLENQRIVINKTQSLIDNYGTIKISRRKCPICDSDFNDAQLTNDKKFIYECSNEQCSYFHGFGV